MHLKRIITALVLAPLFLLLVFKGSYVQYSLLVLILALLGLIEYFGFIGDRLERKIKVLGVIWGLFLSCGFIAASSQAIVAMLTFGFISVCLLRLSKVGDISTVFQDIGYTFLGPMYVGLLLGHLSLIRAMAYGREWTILLFLTVWMGDVAAFYTGSYFGRHKLYPEISPNKTTEGALGNIIGSIIVVAGVKIWYIAQLTIFDVAVISIGISVMGQIGDLCESMFKRASGAKDSGVMIPGHGGVLDRFDSILFAAPFLYYYLLIVKGLH